MTKKFPQLNGYYAFSCDLWIYIFFQEAIPTIKIIAVIFAELFTRYEKQNFPRSG